jgi:hypothetical protein
MTSTTWKILIPALNEYPLKDMKHWAKKAYAHARRQVNWKKAKKIKETLPIEIAAYAEDKVFANWRLVAPSGPTVGADPCVCPNKGVPMGIGAPLQQVLTLIHDEIVPTRWGEFRRKFVCEIKIDFNAICESDYDPKMVDEVNGRLNQLLAQYTCYADGVRINFVLKPETAEDRSSLKNLTIMNGIWMRWTGVPLDFTQFIKSEGSPPICRQMEMYLDIQIT